MLLVCLGLAVALLVIGLSYCAVFGDEGGKSGKGQTSQSASPASQHCRAGEVRLGSPRVAFAVFVRDRAAVFRQPGVTRFATLGRFRRSFVRSNREGVPTVAAALGEVRANDCRALWYRVRLPGRAGARSAPSGYVRAESVTLERVKTRVVVDLSQRRLTLFEDGRPVLVAPVAVGAPSAPTPRGHYFVEERIRVTDSGGPYGAAAIALSAFSAKLTDWPEGGPVAIHGTNDPSSIGEAVSHGCIRLGTRDLRRLFAEVQLGTPVEIVA